MRQKRKATFTCVSRVLLLLPPLAGQGVKVVVAFDQVVGDAQDGGAELAIRGAGAQSLTYFQHFRPIDRVGYSINIYRLDEQDCERIGR